MVEKWCIDWKIQKLIKYVRIIDRPYGDQRIDLEVNRVHY